MFQISSLLHQIILPTSNLRTLMSVSVQPSNRTKYCRIWNFLRRGKSRFVEPGVSNLFSFAPNHTAYLKLENLDAMPGLLVSMSTIHFATFSDLILQDLPIFTFQPGAGSLCALRQFSIKCHDKATCCPCPPCILQLSQWLDSAGFANFLFLIGVYLKLENLDVCQCSAFKQDKILQDLKFS